MIRSHIVSKTVIVTVKMTDNSKTWNSKLVKIEIDETKAVLFNENVLVRFNPKNDLYIVRDCKGQFVRRSISKRNANPGYLNGISLSSYLFGMSHLRRHDSKNDIKIENNETVHCYSRKLFRNDCGYYSAYALFKNLNDDNHSFITECYRQEMESDQKYIDYDPNKKVEKVEKTPVQSIIQQNTTATYIDPLTLLTGTKAQIVTVQVALCDANFNRTGETETITINEGLKHLVGGHCLCRLSPLEFKTLDVIVTHDNYFVRRHKSEYIGIPLMSYLYGRGDLQRSHELRVQNRYDYLTIPKIQTKPFCSFDLFVKPHDHTVVEYRYNLKRIDNVTTKSLSGSDTTRPVYSNYMLEIPEEPTDTLESTTFTSPNLPMVQPPVSAIEPPTVVVESIPSSTIQVDMGNGMITSGSPTDIAQLLFTLQQLNKRG